MKLGFSITYITTVFVFYLCFQLLSPTHGAPDSLYLIPEFSKAQPALINHSTAALWYSSLNKEGALKNANNIVGYPIENKSTHGPTSHAKFPEEDVQTFYEYENSSQGLENTQIFNTHKSTVHPNDTGELNNGNSVLLEKRLASNSPASLKSRKVLAENFPTSVSAKAGLRIANYPTTVDTHQIHLHNESELPIYDPSVAPSRLKRRTADAGSFACVEKIFLWTNGFKRGQEYELLSDAVSVKSSHFLSGAKTYVIFHGFLSDGTQPWVIEMKNKLLRRENCNVISVQWWAGSTVLDYYSATAYVTCTAQETVSVLSTVGVVRQLLPSALHLIGHSLGAHVAGFVGKYHQGVGRITGLDPAGLTYRNIKKSVRLDKTDANYVDVLHTNGCNPKANPWGSCYGIDSSIGHTDFWPNGGLYQPACRALRSATPATEERSLTGEIGCDHEISYKYFIESIDYGITMTKFLARFARNYHDFNYKNLSCGTSIQYMGFFADHQSQGDYFLNTSALQPYAYMVGECHSRVGLMVSWVSFLSACSMLGVTVLGIVMPVIIMLAPLLAAAVVTAATVCGERMRVCAWRRVTIFRYGNYVPIVGNDCLVGQEEGRDQDSHTDFLSVTPSNSSDYQSQPGFDGE
ncbi:Lipase/vitellogenin [Trinorchestia longiramus]|nr:Lipase/vitellogenin [Trinorchestia longiramus]